MKCELMLQRILILLFLTVNQSLMADGFLETIIRKVSPTLEGIEEKINKLERSLKDLPPLTHGQQGEQVGIHSRYMDSAETPLVITVELRRNYKIDFLALVPVSRVFQGANYSAYGFPRGFKVYIAGKKDFSDQHLAYTTGESDYVAPGHYPLIIPVDGKEARYIKISISKHWARVDGEFLSAIGELMVMSGNRNIAVGAKVNGHTFMSLPEWSNDFLVDGQTDLGLPISSEPSKVNGYLSKASNFGKIHKWIELDLGQVYELDEVRLLTAYPLDAPSSYSHGFPVKFKLSASLNSSFDNVQVIADYSEKPYRRLGDNMAQFPAENIKARFIRLDVNELWHISGNSKALALSEMQVFSKDSNVAFNRPVNANDVFNHKDFIHIWNKEGLVDGYSSQNKLIDLDVWLKGLESRRMIENEISESRAQLLRIKEATTNKVINAFIIVVVSLIVLVVLSIYRRRKKMKMELEKVRVQIARDLHDDLGSRIGGIRLVSEVALADSSLEGELREDWESVNECATSAIEAMRDIVWLTDGEAVSSTEMIKHLHKVAEDTLGNIKLNWQVNDKALLTIPFSQRRHIVLSFRETLGNVVKHSKASEVKIQIECMNNKFSFKVDDNGCGFDLKDCTMGRGLNNLQQRADQSGGEFAVNSQAGKGTTVNFTMNLRGLCE